MKAEKVIPTFKTVGERWKFVLSVKGKGK